MTMDLPNLWELTCGIPLGLVHGLHLSLTLDVPRFLGGFLGWCMSTRRTIPRWELVCPRYLHSLLPSIWVACPHHLAFDDAPSWIVCSRYASLFTVAKNMPFILRRVLRLWAVCLWCITKRNLATWTQLCHIYCFGDLTLMLFYSSFKIMPSFYVSLDIM